MKKLKMLFATPGKPTTPCPKCQQPHSTALDYCLYCGFQVFDTGQTKQIFTCPDCGQQTHNGNAVFFSFCAHCNESKEEQIRQQKVKQRTGPWLRETE